MAGVDVWAQIIGESGGTGAKSVAKLVFLGYDSAFTGSLNSLKGCFLHES